MSTDAGVDVAKAGIDKNPRMTCGTLTPFIRVRCRDTRPEHIVEDNNPRTFSTTSLVTSGEEKITDCNINIGNGNKDRPEILAHLNGQCVPEVSSGPMVTYQYRVDANAQRRCGFKDQGSQGEARPLWHVQIQLPDPGSAYRIESTWVPDETHEDRYGFNCVGRVGTQAKDLDWHRDDAIAQDFTGGQTIDAYLDCRSDQPDTGGLAHTSCYGYAPGHDASPPWLWSGIAWTLKVQVH